MRPYEIETALAYARPEIENRSVALEWKFSPVDPAFRFGPNVKTRDLLRAGLSVGKDAELSKRISLVRSVVKKC
jgi:hypothetical protein